MSIRTQTLQLPVAPNPPNGFSMSPIGGPGACEAVRVSNNSPFPCTVTGASNNPASTTTLQPYTTDVYSYNGFQGNIVFRFSTPGNLTDPPGNSTFTLDWSTDPKKDFAGTVYPASLPGTSLTQITGPVDISGNVDITGPVTVEEIIQDTAVYGPSATVYNASAPNGVSGGSIGPLDTGQRYLAVVVYPVGVSTQVHVRIQGIVSSIIYYDYTFTNKGVDYAVVIPEVETNFVVTVTAIGDWHVSLISCAVAPIVIPINDRVVTASSTPLNVEIAPPSFSLIPAVAATPGATTLLLPLAATPHKVYEIYMSNPGIASTGSIRSVGGGATYFTWAFAPQTTFTFNMHGIAIGGLEIVNNGGSGTVFASVIYV